MGKMLDPQNVTMRANRMMTDHLELFEKQFGTYETEGSIYTFNIDEKTKVSIYYDNFSKFLTKTFSTQVRITINNVKMKNSWKAKLDQSGFVKVAKIKFKETDSSSKDIVRELNENDTLMNKIFSLFEKFDFKSVTFDYKQYSQEINITITPYPGAFIWVKLPPLYYDIKLKPVEIDTLHKIAKMFSSFFVRA